MATEDQAGRRPSSQSINPPDPGCSPWTFTGVADNDGAWVVAGVGDINNDGVDDFAVGAPLEDNATVVDAGRVRLFRGSSSGTPLLSAVMSMSVSDPNNCGTSIVGGVDFNYDGLMDIAVGEPKYSLGGANRGRVRVFFGKDGGTIDSVPEFAILGGQAGDKFGSTVSAMDLKKDSYADFVASSPGFTNGQAGEGRIMIRSGAW